MIILCIILWIVLGWLVLVLNRNACSVIAMLDGDGATGAAYALLITSIIFWPIPKSIIFVIVAFIGEKLFRWS